MIYDAALLMASAQASTLTVASTDYIDTMAAGNDYKGCIFAVQVTTAFTATGTPTMQFLLQTSTSSTFPNGSTTATLAVSSTYTASALSLGKMWHVVIPSGAKRYIRGQFKVAQNDTVTNFFTAGAVNMMVLEDIDVDINKRRLI